MMFSTPHTLFSCLAMCHNNHNNDKAYKSCQQILVINSHSLLQHHPKGNNTLYRSVILWNKCLLCGALQNKLSERSRSFFPLHSVYQTLGTTFHSVRLQYMVQLLRWTSIMESTKNKSPNTIKLSLNLTISIEKTQGKILNEVKIMNSFEFVQTFLLVYIEPYYSQISEGVSLNMKDPSNKLLLTATAKALNE